MNEPLVGSPAGGNIIQLRLRDAAQLFDTMDPSPFREKDLDPKAEAYIVESVHELPPRAHCQIVIHLDQPASPEEQRGLADAIHVHFARRAQLLRRNLRQLIRRGFVSLAIGAVFLSVLFISAHLISQLMGESPWGALLREGLLIVGWVAMWRPLEIFLYDWWPIVGERRLYDRLSRIDVRTLHRGRNAAEAVGGGS
jgi:hypothetical protein